MKIHAIYRPFLDYFRSRRNILFRHYLNPSPGERILDVGGYHWFWEKMACPCRIICLNLRIPQTAGALPSQFDYVQGDGRNLGYDDDEFDIVFSNSVIEHLGTYEDQKRFAAEIRRVGKSYWVQTPNRRFFIEPHLIAPFVHWLPRRLQRKILRYGTIWGLVTRPDRHEVAMFLQEVRLLNEKEMRALFPEAMIISERFLGMKKSLTAWHNGRNNVC